jgi:hypothetical protein
MATQVRAWIDDQGSTASRRWLLVQALFNQGSVDEAWGVLRDTPEITPETVLQAQLWIVLCARFRPSARLAEEILALHERFGGNSDLTVTAVNAFVNMGDDKGDLRPDVVARYHELMDARASRAEATDDVFFKVSVPDTPDELIAVFRPHLEPQAIRLHEITAQVAGGWPYGLLSATAGRPYVSALVHRGAGCLPICDPDPRRAELEVSVALDALSNAVAIDSSALTTLWYVHDLWPLLRNAFTRLEFTSASHHDAMAAVEGLTPRPSGFLTWDTRTGRPVMTDADPEQLDRIEAHTNWVANTSREVTVREWPRLTDALPAYDFGDDARFLPWLSSIDLAARSGIPLWADDLGLRRLAQEQGVPAFGTVALLEALEAAGRLTDAQRATALRILREEYCVDLPLDTEWIESSAAATDWQGGPAAFVFSRAATWAQPDKALEIWFSVASAAARSDAALIARWLYAATTGLLVGLPGVQVRPVVGSILARALALTNADSNAFASCIAATRQACEEQDVEDVTTFALQLLFDILKSGLDETQAAAILSQLGEHLEGQERAALRQVLFAVRPKP